MRFIALFALAFFSMGVQAQAYPSKPIRWVVPYTPGGITDNVTRMIAQKLQDGYLVDPQVSVEVLNYRPFYILGEVKAPGSYQYVNGMNVLNAVALAGGFTYRAKQDEFILQRGGSNTAGSEVGIDAPILPGDVITVQERFF